MSWLSSSSVGRKVVMSVTGAALAFFLLFHATMNVVAIISEDGYNAICEFLGANWYALIATVGLTFLIVVHVIYAFILTVQNYRARGKERYEVTARQSEVEWSSKNMLVLGIIVILFIFLHLANFWAKMQFVEIRHMMGADVDITNATNGVYHIKNLFANPIICVLYLVWLAALWFHLTHGVWSALHSLGLNNNTWMPRVKCFSNILATLIVLMFAVVVVYFFGVAVGEGTVWCCCQSACCAA